VADDESYTISPSVRTRELDDELVLLDLNQGLYLSLNESGRAVWRAVESGSTLASIEAEMVAAWPVSREEAQAMVRGLLRDLIDRGLIVRSGP